MEAGVKGVHCVAVDTDRYHLHIAKAHSKVQLETKSEDGTRGDIDLGKKAAVTALARIKTAIGGVDLVFILAGIGGGTGGGAATVAAEVARKNGALVVGLITKPFFHERRRVGSAVDSLRVLLRTCDTVVLVDNYGAAAATQGMPFSFDLDIAGQTACSLVSSITRSFHNPSSLSFDINELRAMLRRGGLARAGVSGWYPSGGAEEAMLTAVRNIVPHCDLAKAEGVYLGISGDGGLHESDLSSTLELISRRINPNADFFYAHHLDQGTVGLSRISLLATGVSFPYTWGGYRRVPMEIFEMEPE
jgi:cell division protein FtsZ